MTTFAQMSVQWNGAAGLPGYTNLYFAAIDDFAPADVQGAFNIIKDGIPSSITITIPNQGKTFDLASGQPNGTWSHGVQKTVTGTNATQYAAPVGGVVNYHTGLYLGGREVRGKTFIVPMCANTFEPNGTFASLWVGNLKAFGDALNAATADLSVWSRKQGALASVQSVSVPDKAAVLRSRRD